MTDMISPEKARVFLVGYNQATRFPAALVGDHDAYIDALFNRNGKSCRNLYEEMRCGKGPSLTRKNTDTLREGLSKLGVKDVIETNVIWHATPMSDDLTHAKNQGGKARGGEIFLEILEKIRPIILVAHGRGTAKELARQVLSTELPAAASKQACGVSCALVRTRLPGPSYTPRVLSCHHWRRQHGTVGKIGRPNT